MKYKTNMRTEISKMKESPSCGIDLIEVKNGQAVTSSLVVAEYFGKAHKDVLRAINSLDCSDLFRKRNFAPSEYTKINGNIVRSYPMYYLTRDGFTFLAMGFTGKVAAQFKEAYINAFNEMEEMLHKNDCTKYAEKIFKSELNRFDKRLKENAAKIREENGIGYGIYGEIRAGVYDCDKLPFQERIRNVFAQVGNAYTEAYYLAGKYLNSDNQNKQMRKLLADFGGKLVENFSIYPRT